MIETPLGPLYPDAVAAGYLRYSVELRTNSPDAVHDPQDLDKVAYEALDRAVCQGPAVVAWDLVLRLLHQAPDADLSFHAAGPLEDLVRLWGTELVDPIEAEAAGDKRFRGALGCIWLSIGDLPPAILDRVVRASGGEIKPLDPEADREHHSPVT